MLNIRKEQLAELGAMAGPRMIKRLASEIDKSIGEAHTEDEERQRIARIEEAVVYGFGVKMPEEDALLFISTFAVQAGPLWKHDALFMSIEATLADTSKESKQRVERAAAMLAELRAKQTPPMPAPHKH